MFYAQYMEKDGSWATDNDIAVLSAKENIRICVYTQSGTQPGVLDRYLTANEDEDTFPLFTILWENYSGRGRANVARNAHFVAICPV